MAFGRPLTFPNDLLVGAEVNHPHVEFQQGILFESRELKLLSELSNERA